MRQKKANAEIQSSKLLPRPPVVVVLGHVDHGKTTLLDKIRKTNVAAKEAGEITQLIGAYEIIYTPPQTNTNKNADKQLDTSVNQHNNQRESAPAGSKRITFIDTPGHEAFNKMREHGARVADLAILVVAADEGLKPQTKESIEILNKTQTPFIVAINKIDKPTANINKVINDLTEQGVLLEKYGGQIPWQTVSAKTGEGINELLELILLVAEMENLTYSPDSQANGIIIESKLDPKRGISASVILKNGILRQGELIATESAFGKIKILENFLGQKVDSLSPSAPALILGFETMPKVGEEFFAGKINLAEIQIIKEKGREKPEVKPTILETNQSKNYINLILKADTIGSLEALKNVLSSISLKDNQLNFLEEEVGDITDNDIKLAQATNAIIIGFRTKTQKSAEKLAKIYSVKIISSEIIYELGKILEETLALTLPKAPEILGKLEVLAVFNQKTKKQIIGGKVLSGALKKNVQTKIMRNEKEIGFGKIINLQLQKKDATEVESGNECGLLFESDTKINVGDILIYEA